MRSAEMCTCIGAGVLQHAKYTFTVIIIIFIIIIIIILLLL